MDLYSPSIFKALNGVFCIYKPSGKSNRQILDAIKMNLARELNKLPCRPLRLRKINLQDENQKLISEVNSRTNSLHDSRQFDSLIFNQEIGSVNLNNHNELNKNIDIISPTNLQDRPFIKDESLISNQSIQVPDLADHPLVVGPRYLPDDFNLLSANPMKTFSSGVTLIGIGNGLSIIRPIVNAKLMRVYHVSGKLGLSTQDFTYNGRIIEQSTYAHVNKERLDRVIAGIQAGHQRHMFSAAGIDLQTEEAYQLACKGLLRPTDPKFGPVIYGMRCIHFKEPDFTLEIHAINETCVYLMKIIHELGLELRTNAVCTKLRRIRFGQFTLEHALLFPKHTRAHFLIDNLRVNRTLLNDVYHTANIRNLPSNEFKITKTNEIQKDFDIECFINNYHGFC